MKKLTLLLGIILLFIALFLSGLAEWVKTKDFWICVSAILSFFLIPVGIAQLMEED